MNSMRLLRLSTCVLLWSISARDVHGSVQMMLLKALKHVKTVPIILSVSRGNSRNHRALASDLVDVKTLPNLGEKVADASTISHEPVTYHKKKFTKKSRTQPKVEYIYLKGSYPKKYRRKSYQSHMDYFHGPVKKELLYEDEDHKFIRVSASKPYPRYTHVRVIHVNTANAKECPYLASQGLKTPHPVTQNVVGKHGAASHSNAVDTQHQQQQKHHDVKHVVHHINYLSPPQNHDHRAYPSKHETVGGGIHDHREAYATKHETVVGGTHDQRQNTKPEAPVITIAKAPPRHEETVQTHGPTSSAISYHKDTTSSIGHFHNKPQIELHLVNDQMPKHLQEKESNFHIPQYFASSAVHHRPRVKTNHHRHQIPQHDFYQPRFPDEAESPLHLESHMTTNFHEIPSHHDDDNSIFAESAVYADVMTRWPGKNAVVISNVKGTPVLFTPAKHSPLRFQHGIRKRNGQNFIDVTIH